MTRALPVDLDVDGVAAPPRRNGELVFAEPWQSRAFGMTMALTQAGAFDWEDFRQELISQIAGWEATAQPGECFSYYRCWLDGLERLLVTRELVAPGAVRELAEAIAARPAGWDHDHDHGAHDHGAHDHGAHDHGAHEHGAHEHDAHDHDEHDHDEHDHDEHDH